MSAGQLHLFDAEADAPPAPRALSLWQPWAYAITHLGKRVDNRPWKPWRSVIGHRIALHAALGHGTSADYADARARILQTAGVDVDDAVHRAVADAQRGKIVATARVDGFVTASADPWFFGPIGWLLSDVCVLEDPIPCSGMRGLWPVPEGLVASVLSTGCTARTTEAPHAR